MNTRSTHRTDYPRKLFPYPPIQRLIAVLLLALSSNPGLAIDLGGWARHLRRYDDWTALDFRDPWSGLFLAARAGTEDSRTKATLTVTAALKQDCAPDFTIAIDLGQPASVATEESVHITVRLDGAAPRAYAARLVRAPGDSFLFVQWLGGLDPDLLRNHQTMVVAISNSEFAVFSLKGFEPAWAAAQAACQSFMPPEAD